MPGVTGRQLNSDQRKSGHDGRAQDSGGAITQALAVVMTMIVAVTGPAMCVEVHCLNSTRRKPSTDSGAALVSRVMQLDVRFSLREPETQLTHSRHAPTMKLIDGFLQNSEKPTEHRARNGPSMPQNSAKLIFWGVRGSTPTLERDT